MAEPDKKGGTPASVLEPPTPDEASSLAVRPDDTAGEPREAADAPSAGGKATVRKEEVAGCALDTIEDTEGHYLEPPD
ncbi:MAG: hypothetical protein ACXU86_20200 [Archangium sp.]